MRYSHYVAHPLSIRFDEGLLDRLRRRAASVAGATPSGLAQRLVEEGLRQAEHPGVVFRDGPSGRRAALAVGPDVWEVVRVLQEIDERGAAAVEATAEVLSLPVRDVGTVIDYYGAHRAEIDREIAEADQASLAAEQAWRTRQQLLA